MLLGMKWIKNKIILASVVAERERERENEDRSSTFAYYYAT
jgi:hypothetical protein